MIVAESKKVLYVFSLACGSQVAEHWSSSCGHTIVASSSFPCEQSSVTMSIMSKLISCHPPLPPQDDSFSLLKTRVSREPGGLTHHRWLIRHVVTAATETPATHTPQPPPIPLKLSEAIKPRRWEFVTGLTPSVWALPIVSEVAFCGVQGPSS